MYLKGTKNDRNSKLAKLRDLVFPGEQRKLGGVLGIVITIAAASLCLITLYMAFRMTLGPIPTRGLHLAVVLPLTFLLYPFSKRNYDAKSSKPTFFDFSLALAAIAAFGWAIYSADRFETRLAYSGSIPTEDMVLGIIGIITVFEATRRTVGMIIVWITLIFIIYALTGPIWPGIFEHRGTNLTDLIETLYMLPTGVFNFILGIMATYIFTFLTFGVFLRVSGGDKIFTDLAMALAGHRRGGPAKVAVVSSSLMGMLSGSTVSNVVTTGSMTIPMMKKVGFRPYEAAAIETTASLGGALAPPMMGAGVFIMAAFIGIPLITILKYSLLPAILYYISLYFYVDVKARKLGLKGLSKEKLPKAWQVIKYGGHIFLPVVALIVLLIMDFTAFFASSVCVVMAFVVSFLNKNTWLTPPKLAIALEGATRVTLTVSSLAASAAIIYGVITITGLLVKVTSIILTLSGGYVFVAIVLIALMSYVLGMGLPVTAAYVLIATLGAPALADLGLSMLAAHLIIFWFSQDSTITPPICMTAFVGARIANAPPMKTGWQSVLMAKGLYIIPFAFAYCNLLDTSIFEILFDFISLSALFALLPIAIEGYWSRKLKIWTRLIFVFSAVLFFIASVGPASSGLPWFVLTSFIMIGAFFIESYSAKDKGEITSKA